MWIGDARKSEPGCFLLNYYILSTTAWLAIGMTGEIGVST